MGTIQKQGISNTVLSYLGIMIGFVNILVLQPYMLQPHELGLTRILYSVSIFFATIFPIGLNSVILKFFPLFRDKESNNHGFLTLVLIVSFIGYSICGASIYLLRNEILLRYTNSPLFVEYFSFVFPLTFFLGYISLLNVYSFALFKSSVPVFLNEVLIRFLSSVVVSLYFIKIIDFNGFMYLFLLSYALQLSLLVMYVLRIDKVRISIDWKFIMQIGRSRILHYALWMAVGTIASIAIRNIDIMFLGSNLSGSVNALELVGIYTIAITIGGIIEAPSNALSRIGDSKIADAFARGDNRMIHQVYFQSTKILTLVGGLLFLGVVLNVNELLSLLPPKYQGSSWIVITIGISSLANMITGLNTSIMYYSDKYVAGNYMLIFLVAISALLNYILIPEFGALGAAISTATALVLYNIIKYLYIWKVFHMQPFDKTSLKILAIIVIALIGGLLIPSLDQAVLTIMVRSSVITVIYLVLTYWLNIVPEFHHYLPWIKKIGGK